MFYYSRVEYLGVLFATLISIPLSSWWYSTDGFGRAWLACSKNTINELGNPRGQMILSFISTFISAIALSLFLIASPPPTFFKGAYLGLAVGIGLISTAMFTDFIYNKYSMQLFLIQAGYRVVLMVVMGAILGLWYS